jgi:sugar/nucleoside kinase (ribokinase family)
MKAERLKELIGRFTNASIVVLGDFFLDKYLDVDPALAETSLETGKLAHQVVSVRCSPGAAGTVVNNLSALGAGRLHALGFTGDDGEGYELRRALSSLGCKTDGLLVRPERFTPTYLKPRDWRTAGLSGEHSRYDTKNRLGTPAEVQEGVLSHLERILPETDAVVILDQVEEAECGIVTSRVRERLADLSSLCPTKVFWADSRRRIRLFRNVIIKCNLSEIGGLPQSIELREHTGKPVFVTAGAKGIWVSDPRPELVRGVAVPEPTDPTGAGDSATAGAVLALCAGADLREAALVANLVASITVQQLDVTGSASPGQLIPRLEMWEKQGAVH